MECRIHEGKLDIPVDVKQQQNGHLDGQKERRNKSESLMQHPMAMHIPALSHQACQWSLLAVILDCQLMELEYHR